MKKLLLSTAIAVSLSMPAFAEIGNYFTGANGGIRHIDNQVLEADGSTTFTIRTVKVGKKDKIRTFTVSATGEVSGNGKKGFKDFLRNNAEIESNDISDNELAFNAWAESVGDTTDYSTASSFDWIGITERLGINVNYNPVQFGTASESINIGNITIDTSIGSANADPVRNKYTVLGIGGLEQAHADGWTGNNVKIAVKESLNTSHIRLVKNVASNVAPEAELHEIHWSLRPDRNDIVPFNDLVAVNHSYGLTRHFGADHHGGWAARVRDNNLQAPNAVHIYASGNNAGSCSYGRTVDTCTGFKEIVDTNQLDLIDNSIIVGTLQTTMNTFDAGSLKDHFIVTSPQTWGDYNGNTYTMNGQSSAAAPKVTGTAALVKQKFPGLNAQGIKSAILNGAIDIGAPGVDEVYGHGLLSVAGALSPSGELN